MWAFIVVVAYILHDDSSDLLNCSQGNPLDALSLKLLIKRFHKGVVIHLFHPIHALLYPVLVQSLTVFLSPYRSTTPFPGIVAVPADAIYPTHQSNSVFVFVLVYEFEDFPFRWEENWMAFFKMPCSSLRRL